MKKILFCVSICLILALITGCSETIPNSTSGTNAEIPPNESSSEVESESASDQGPQEIENPDFRNVKWGMSVEEVKKQEDADLLAEFSDELQYSAHINETIPCKILYGFNDANQLYIAAYNPTADYSNDYHYYIDFLVLKERLTEVYGAPTADNEIWYGNLFKGSPEKYGLAISAGYLECLTKWEVDGTSISLYIYGNNFEISTTIMYKSLDVKKAASESNSGL